MLSALAAGLIRCIYIDGLYQLMQDIRGKLPNANILACFLNKLLNMNVRSRCCSNFRKSEMNSEKVRSSAHSETLKTGKQ